MLKQNKIVVKKFLLSIKNAVMAMSIESLKESFLQEVLDNFKAMNNLKDSGFDMDSPIVIKVGERKEIKVLPSFVNDMEDPKWEFNMDDSKIATFSVENNSVYIEGVKEGSTLFSCAYSKQGFKDIPDDLPPGSFPDYVEISSIEVVVEDPGR